MTTLSVRDIKVTTRNGKRYLLSVTARDKGDSPRILEELIFRTVNAWLWIVGGLEQGVRELPCDPRTQEAFGSIEMRLASEMKDTDGDWTFPQIGEDARVTVWDLKSYEKDDSNTPLYSRINFHLNSDDLPQVAVNIWWAMENASIRVREHNTTPQEKVQKAAQTIQNAQEHGADYNAATDTPATPKNVPQTPPQTYTLNPGKPASPTNRPQQYNGESPLLTKKDAIAKLQTGDKFRMKIVQIEKHSKDGKDFYEFFEPYGGKAGQYAAASVFVDNEVAQNNGLIAYLDTLGVKLGQALTGEWITECSIAKPKTKTVKGEEKTFTNIYVNRFEGQELAI